MLYLLLWLLRLLMMMRMMLLMLVVRCNQRCRILRTEWSQQAVNSGKCPVKTLVYVRYIRLDWNYHYSKVVWVSPILLVDLCLLDALIFRATILEPYFDLCFGKLQHFRQLEPSASGNVFVSVKFYLQSEGLLAAERGALAAWTSFLFATSGH